jgi:hypothetical protein
VHAIQKTLREQHPLTQKTAIESPTDQTIKKYREDL